MKTCIQSTVQLIKQAAHKSLLYSYGILLRLLDTQLGLRYAFTLPEAGPAYNESCSCQI